MWECFIAPYTIDCLGAFTMPLSGATRTQIATDMAASGLPSATFFGSLGCSGTEQFAKDWILLAAACKAANDTHAYPDGVSRVSPISVRETELVCDVNITAITTVLAPESVIEAADESGPNGFLGSSTLVDMTGNALLVDSAFFQVPFTVSPLQVLIDTAKLLNVYDLDVAEGYQTVMRLSSGENSSSGSEMRFRSALECQLNKPLLPMMSDIIDFV